MHIVFITYPHRNSGLSRILFVSNEYEPPTIQRNQTHSQSSSLPLMRMSEAVLMLFDKANGRYGSDDDDGDEEICVAQQSTAQDNTITRKHRGIDGKGRRLYSHSDDDEATHE